MILSDYAKGVLTPKVIRAVIDRAKKLGKPVIVDPKGSDFSIYRGATVITPNRKELAEAVHRRVDTGDEVADAVWTLFAEHPHRLRDHRVHVVRCAPAQVWLWR